MKKYTLSLIALTFLFIGCGNDDSKTKNNQPNKVNSVKDATKSLNALNSFQSINFSIASSVTPNSQNKLLKILTNQTLTKLQKTQTSTCVDGGNVTFDLSEDTKTIKYLFDNCKNGTTFMDGSMTMLTQDDNSYSIDYDKLTVKTPKGTQYMDMSMKFTENNILNTTIMNGVVKQTSSTGEINNISMTNFVIKDQETKEESWHTIDGKMNLETKCFTGAYVFKTIEKMIDATDGSDNTQSGTLELNGATYTFENPHVTIKAGNESETILQSELEKRMTQESACNI